MFILFAMDWEEPNILEPVLELEGVSPNTRVTLGNGEAKHIRRKNRATPGISLVRTLEEQVLLYDGTDRVDAIIVKPAGAPRKATLVIGFDQPKAFLGSRVTHLSLDEWEIGVDVRKS